LAIDWGKKYIWLAYIQTDIDVVLPVGYLLNSGSVLYEIASLCVEKRVSTIVVWIPQRSSLGDPEDRGTRWVCDQIEKFVAKLQLCVSEDINFAYVDEHYSSVEAVEKIVGQKIIPPLSPLGKKGWKTVAEDTLSAMVILERRRRESA